MRYWGRRRKKMEQKDNKKKKKADELELKEERQKK